MRESIVLASWLVLTGMMLAACATPTPLNVAPTLQSAPTPTPDATAPASVAGAWKTFRNDRVGYAVDYPATWKIDERIDPDGADVTTFSPIPDQAGVGMTLIVRDGKSGAGGITDLPNSRCQPVMVGQLSGTRCFDTIAFSTTTTFMDRGRAFILVSSGKRLAPDIYQRFLESFIVKS